MAHQRVQLQGKVAETESRAAIMRESMQEKVSRCKAVCDTTITIILREFVSVHIINIVASEDGNRA